VYRVIKPKPPLELSTLWNFIPVINGAHAAHAPLISYVLSHFNSTILAYNSHAFQLS